MKKLREKKYRYPILALLLTAAGVILLYYLTGIHPFGKNSVIVGDLGGMYLPFYSAVGRSLNDSFSAYSFEKSLGGGIEGLAAYIPFTLYMLFTPFLSKMALIDFFSVLLFLKLTLAAGLFCFLVLWGRLNRCFFYLLVF